MPADFIPPSTRLRRNRVHNHTTDTLRNRRAYMLANLRDIADSRMDFAYKAYELQAIENVLVDRGDLALADRRTVAGNQRGTT